MIVSCGVRAAVAGADERGVRRFVDGRAIGEGANDLVLKPIEERLLVTKALFQLRLAKLPEPGSFSA